MRREFQLTASVTSRAVDLDFPAVALVVDNPTGSPVYVRTGAPDIPSQLNANLIVPAAVSRSTPTSGYQFGLALGDPALLATGNSAVSGLFSTVTVTFLSAGELIPTFGSASYLTLSLSDLSGGISSFSGPITRIYDLNPWGGALVSVAASGSSGQGILVASISSDGVTFTPLGSWAFWPNVPSVLNVPRVIRYLKIELQQTAIPGEPAIGGAFSARGSLEEIQEVAYNASSDSMILAFTVPSSGAIEKIVCTVGVPAVNIGVLGSTGTRGAVTTDASQNPTGPWRNVMEREQSWASQSIDRSIGIGTSFMRIRIHDTGTGGLTGTLYLSTSKDADTVGSLERIYRALGDPLWTPNTNQSIYHSLETIRGLLGIGGPINTNLAAIHNSDLPAQLVQLGLINTNTNNTNVNVAAIHNSDMPSLINNTGSGGSININAAAIHNNTQDKQLFPSTVPAFLASGALQSTVGVYVTAKLVGFLIMGSGGGAYSIAWGTAGAVSGVVATVLLTANTTVEVFFPTNRYINTGGAPTNVVWLSGPAGSTIGGTVYTSA